MPENRVWNWKFILAGLWLVFTISFAIWWMILGLNQIDQIQNLLNETTQLLERQRRMMLWEGAAWVVLIFAGGTWLIGLLLREEKRSRTLTEFFAAFSHEIKTAITSLRLQAESLKEDLSTQNHPALQRLVADTVRLHLQLENSLFLSQEQDYSLYIETLSLNKLIQSIRHQWPDIQIELSQDAALQADERAMKTVLSNLIHNAVVHGEARKIKFSVKRSAPKQVRIEFYDDGRGFSGDWSELGRPFFRHNRRSGSGIGLFIVRDLVAKMKGKVEFFAVGSGFGGAIQMEGSPL